MPTTSRKKTFAGIVIVILTLLGWSLVWRPVMNRFTSSDVRAAYQRESAALGPVIESLGIHGAREDVAQCYPEDTTIFQTHEICQNFAKYPYTTDPIPSGAREKFSQNASRLDKLLKSRGWTIDRPQDRIRTIADSNPYSPVNGGEGGEVPYHKNIGPISCNLRINFSALSNLTSPAAINVDEFGCSQHVSYPDFNIHPRHYNTV